MLMLISLIIATDVDLKHHVKEISKVLVWEDMKDVAVKSGITRDRIDKLVRYHRGDPTDWTLLLLHQWVKEMEKKGNNAARELVEKLTDLGYTKQRGESD